MSEQQQESQAWQLVESYRERMTRAAKKQGAKHEAREGVSNLDGEFHRFKEFLTFPDGSTLMYDHLNATEGWIVVGER